MVRRLRTAWLAGSGALLFVFALSGVVAAASVLTAITAPTTGPTLVSQPGDEPVADTTLTFEDLDGDGIDDDCDDAVADDPEAAGDAEEAIDLDGDGTISTSEAARSNRVGGKNCNHGGYVSAVARDLDEATSEDADDADADADEDAVEAECEEVPAPEPPADFDPQAANAHGKWVSLVARSGAVGGKNCNHGGAVSEAAHEDKAAREAAKDLRKAEQEAARNDKKADKETGPGKGNGH